MYQDVHDEVSVKKSDLKDITDDIVYETELIKQIEINIDYILLLIKKFHDSHTDDKELRISIQKAIDSSPELRSKKALIETFIEGIEDIDDVLIHWNSFVYEQRDKNKEEMISKFNLKEEELDTYLSKCWGEGEVIETGEDLDSILPPVSRFGRTNRKALKQEVLDELKKFFNMYYSITSYDRED